MPDFRFSLGTSARHHHAQVKLLQVVLASLPKYLVNLIAVQYLRNLLQN